MRTRTLYGILVLCLFVIGVVPTTAQEKEHFTTIKDKHRIESMQRSFMMSFSLGSNFNTGGNDYSEWFGSRADVATQFDMRMNVAFARNWCAYFDLGLSFYKVQTDDLVQNIGNALLDELIPGLSKIKPSVALGVSYIVERNRWQLMPRVGIGWMSAGCSSDNSTTVDGKTTRLEIDRSPMFFNAGTSIGYRTSNKCSVIFDVSYRFPMQSCKAIHTTTLPDIPPVIVTNKSHSWANDLSVSIGIQLQMDLKKKK